MPMSLEDRYNAAAHRMQSATALDVTRRLGIGVNAGMGDLEVERLNTAIKDCRVGLNSALSNAGGLVELLISKGVFTKAEYVEAITVAMEREADTRVAEVIERHNLPPSTRFL